MINQRQGVSTRESLNRPRIGNRRFSSERHLGLKQQKVAFSETDTVEPARPRPLLTKTQKHRVYDPEKGKFIINPNFAGPLNIDACDLDTCYFTPDFKQFRRKETVKPMAVELTQPKRRVPPPPKRKQQPLNITRAPQTRAEITAYRPVAANVAEWMAANTRR